ncbi:MAG: hypothetical protein EHM35_04425 [Planctomycetaceae bacterium]|nr:MAG: hypothetical protein EHM35_04425 [Planctomycetaceae bacterium]
MLWVGICIGTGLGMAIASIGCYLSPIGIERRRLEREIAGDNLKCAREERRAAALRVIAMNEQQAGRSQA